MRRFHLLGKWCLGLCLATPAFAEIFVRPLPGPVAVPAIEVEEPTRYQSNRLQLAAEFSMLTPTIFQNGGTQIEQTSGGIPVVSLGAKLPLFRRGRFQFDVEAQAGIGTGSGTFQVNNGTLRNAESARVVWIPASLEFTTEYEFAGLLFVKPALSLGVGGQYFTQRNLAGGLRDIVSPFFTVHPHLLFLQNSDPNGWFGGFTFGLTRWWGVGPSRVDASSIDMAFLFNL